LEKPLVSVVIPTFNRKNDLLECLIALLDSSYDNIEIIVVDNASTDGTYKAVKQMFPKVRLIQNKRNEGVTGGRNRGTVMAKGDYILYLDHDMVVDKQMIEELMKIIEADPKIGMVGPVIYFYDEPSKVWAAGTSINMLIGKVDFNILYSDKTGRDTPFDVQVLPAALMVRKKLLREIGLFNDVFFAVYEDTDFCFRVREAGYRVVCVPKAKAWHKISVDPAKQELHVLSRSYYIARNRIIFMKKHAKTLNFLIFLIVFVPLYAAYYTWRSLRHGSLNSIKEYWRGIFDGLWKIM
jgi:GT2 family glycosyltransferase